MNRFDYPTDHAQACSS